jgi:ABC-2 type transport system ATP-binding protein
MAQLTAENAWVEFPVEFSRSARIGTSRTGGEIDRDRSVVTALRDISFELHEGDRLGLMGHNGAGKTTMLRMLAGAYPPTRGRITSVGRISTLFNATPGLTPDGTGRENIVTCALHLGLTRRQIAAKMDEIIAFAELGDYIDLPVRIYSAGMTTRLGFSIATAVEPEILLLDEGLATGDAQFAQKAKQRMNELITRSSILVIASHSETLLAGMCNRCLLLEHGRIVADGPPRTLLEQYRQSVIEAARTDDPDGLHRAYTLATDMMRAGEKPPLDLQEQSLRYVLRLRPDDAAMIQRYLDVVRQQGRSLAPAVEAELILRLLAQAPERQGLRDRLAALLPEALDGLEPELRARALDLAGRQTTESR